MATAAKKTTKPAPKKAADKVEKKTAPIVNRPATAYTEWMDNEGMDMIQAGHCDSNIMLAAVAVSDKFNTLPEVYAKNTKLADNHDLITTLKAIFA